MISIDHQIVHSLGAIVGRYVWLDSTMIALSVYGPYVFELMLVVLWFAGSNKSAKDANRKRALYGFISALIAMAVNLTLGSMIFRTRPYLRGESALLCPSATDSSFPSDHAAGGGSIATSIYYGKRVLGRALLVLAVLVCISRVYVGAHYPSDVIVGLVIGMLSAWLVERNKRWCDAVVIPLLKLYDATIVKVPFLRKIGF